MGKIQKYIIDILDREAEKRKGQTEREGKKDTE